MFGGGAFLKLEVRDNVVFQDNSCSGFGGAVSPQFDLSFLNLHMVVVCYTFCEIWLGSLRKLIFFFWKG